MLSGYRPREWSHPHVSLACITPTPLEIPMMNRIRTRIEAKRANNQLQSLYLWRPGPGRK